MTEAPTGNAVTTDTVLALIDAAPGSDRDSLLRTARDGRHKLAGTLLSLWAVGGEDLTDGQAAELRTARERVDRYRRVWEELQEHAPDAFPLKGATIAALYPPGVLRSAGDLDVICPRHADLWACARHLLACGWELVAFTVKPAHPGDTVSPHLGAEFRKPAPDTSQDPYAVGLFTAEIVTDVHGPARQLARPPGSAWTTSAVALVAERWERPFRSRDLLDLVLLLQAMDEEAVRQFGADLDRVGLWPEWRQAMRGVARLGWRPTVALPYTRAAAVRVRLARSVRTAMRWSNPVRAAAFAAQSGIEGRGGARPPSPPTSCTAGPARAGCSPQGCLCSGCRWGAGTRPGTRVRTLLRVPARTTPPVPVRRRPSPSTGCAWTTSAAIWSRGPRWVPSYWCRVPPGRNGWTRWTARNPRPAPLPPRPGRPAPAPLRPDDR